MERFIPQAGDEDIKREKARARKLRESAWWKRKRSRGACHYCGKKFPPSELTMDHVIPIVRGGRSEKANLVASCKDCNSKKKHMLPMEWREYLDRVQDEDVV